MRYSEQFKERMVRRMLPPESISAMQLSLKVGASQASLSRWLHRARVVVVPMAKKNPSQPAAKPARSWSPKEKIEAVFEAAAIPDEELGAYLRRRGLHDADLRTWREIMMESSKDTLGPAKRRKKAKPTNEQERIKSLERELRRKEKALAKVTALLVLKKEVLAIRGDGDDDSQ